MKRAGSARMKGVVDTDIIYYGPVYQQVTEQKRRFCSRTGAVLNRHAQGGPA